MVRKHGVSELNENEKNLTETYVGKYNEKYMG